MSARLAVACVLLLAACDGTTPSKPDDTPVEEPFVCPGGRAVSGQLVGAALARPDVYVAAFDASTWRLDDAAAVSDVAVPDPASGAFALCLAETVAIPKVYAKAFVAAWQDLDGDQRYDATSEDLCDATMSGGTSYLYYGLVAEGEGWTVGVERAGFGALSFVYAPVIDGDACRR